MIHEFTVHAKPGNNKAKITFWVLLALSAVDFIAYLLMRRFEVEKSGLVGVVALALIVAAVTIYTKYVSPDFYYEITHDTEGTALFVVSQMIGKRKTTLCRIALYEIVKIERESKAERRAHKTPYSYRKYVYFPTMLPEASYRLTTRSRYEQAEILIEITDELAETLRAYVSEAKAIEAEKDATDPY